MHTPQITTESRMLARQWFADNALACIAEVKSGAVRVNNPETFFVKCLQNHDDALAGKFDRSLTFMQRAHYIQTGDCPALLS